MQIIFNPGTTIEDLESVANRIRNQEPMVLSIGNALSEYIILNWGKGWPGLSLATIALKARLGYPADPLVRTGVLKGDIASGEWQAGRRGNEFIGVLEIPGYGGFHITGTQFMPARDFSFIPDSIEPIIANIAEEYIFGGILF